MMLPAYLFGLISLLFGIWISYGLYRRYHGILPDMPKRRKWLLGVCEDFSRMVGIPLAVMRLFFLLYTPLVFGPALYLIYYLVMRVRSAKTQTPVPVSQPQITKIESLYYRN